MHLFILLSILSFICLGCSHDNVCIEEAPCNVNSKGLGLKGTLLNHRYYSEDGAFSVNLEGFNMNETEIFEGKGETSTSVTFAFNSGPIVRYDMFPIDDIKMLFSLCEAAYRDEFFKLFLHQILLPPFSAQCPSICVSAEEVVVIGDESYYFGLLRGPISVEVNSATGQRSEDYAGILIGLKGQNILVIQLQRGKNIYRSKETAKEELLTRLLYFHEECFVEQR
jgi:hypothetical protein